MPFSCPNKNTPEWRKLFLAVGRDRAYDLYTENNFDIPTEFVVRAQDIRKIIKLYKTEIGQDKLIKVKKALDRYNTVNNTSHSLDITPIGESTESKVKLVLNFNPRNAQKYQDKLDRRSEEDKMFRELEEEPETEEVVRDIDYYMGDEQLMQQEEGTFYQTENSIKPGVSEVFESNPELSSIGTQQLYSQYLESLNKPNTNPILQGNQEEQVKKFVELQERLNNKEFLEGAKNAFESSEELQQFGTQEEYNDYIARVSLGIVKNPTSGEYNYESKVKDIVYHGGEKTFEQFSLETGNRASGTSQIKKGIYFTNKKNVAKTYVYSKETATIKAFNSIISSMEYSLGIKKLTKEEEMYGVDIPTKASDTIKKAEKEYNTTFKGIVNDFKSIRYDDNTYYSIAGNIDLSKVDGELLLSYLRNDNIEGVKSLYENYIKENKPSEKLYSVLINLINPTTLNNNGKPTSIYHILNQNIDKANNAQSLIINDVNDQVKSVFKEITDTDSEITYVVFDPEQIHILGSKQDIEGFKEFVSKDSYQIEFSKETPDSKIESTIKSWLEKVGIKYSAVDKIYDSEGNEVSAVAKADIVGKLIEVVEGKRGIDTLPEEAGHILVRMLGSEHPLVQVMMKNISNYKIYQDVIENDNYVRAYNNDETKLREEAVGKMIAQVLVAKMTGKELNPEQRKEENRILAAWKWLVNRLGRLIGTNAKDELFAFKQAADIIIEHTPIEVSEEFKNPFESKTIFYQLDDNQVQKVIEKLQETNAYYDVTQKAYFTKEGRRIKKRVSDIVKAMESRWFKNKVETEMSPENKKHAVAGTITHAYFKEVTLTILEQIKDDYSKAKYAKLDFSTIQNRVLAELRNDPELKTYGEDFLKSFNATHFTEVVNDVIRRFERVQMTQDRINKETNNNGKAKVFPEFTIFSPEKDLAGTIDLLVVYSNGKTSVYDYKGQYFKTKAGKVIEDFKGTKIRSGRAQTNEYKKILKEEYGIEEFIEVRLIPFNFQYNRVGNISKIEVGNTTSDRTYLSEVPTELETTGIKVLDEQLEKMFKIREELEGKLLADPFNSKLKLQLDRLNTSITKITVDKDTRYVYKEVHSIIEDFQQRLTRPDSLGITFEYLNDVKYYLTMYANFFKDAKKFELSVTEDTAKKVLIENSYNKIHVDIQDILMDIDEKTQDLITAKNPDLDFEKPVQEISQLGALFTRLSQFSRAQFKALHRLVVSKEQYVRTKVQEVYDELNTRRTELNIWAKNKGISLQEATDLMIDLKRGQLKSKYNGVYTHEKQQAIKDKNYKWFEENTQIRRTVTGYEYTNPEHAKKFADLKKGKLEQLANQHPVGSEMYNKKKEEWESKHDITVNRDAIFNKPYYINLIEQDRFLSEFWLMAKKPENKPLMDAYNSLIKINQIASEITGRKIDTGFIPEIQQGIIESLSNWNAGIGAIRDNIKRSFIVEEESMLMGRRDVNTGEQIPTIPLLYTHELTVSLTERELEEVKNDLKSKGILEGTEEYTDRLNSIIKIKEREKGILFKSRDLFTSALLFSETAYSHEYAKSIEEEVKALKYSLENVETELSSPNGKKILDKLTGKIATVVGAPKDEMEAFEKYIQLYIYGRQKQNKDFVVGEVSANKTITQVMRYTSLKALGLSWIVGVGNATGLTGNLLMAASEGKYYNKSQVLKAISMMKGGKDKERINAILQYISPYTHNITYEKSRNLSTKTAKKVFNEELFYVFMKYPDMAVDIINALGILQNYGIDEQGRIRKIDGKIKPIIETLNTSGDKVTGLTETQYAAIRKLITTSSVKLKGSIFKEDANLIGTNVYLSMFMQFRNWMPGLIEQRFGKLKYNEDIGELEVGRFKVAYGEFTAKGVMPKLAAFIDLGTEVLSFGAYRNFSNKASMAVAEKYFQTFLEQNPELKGKVTIEEFMELREQKLRGMAMELRILLSLLGLLQLIRAAIPDDDEDKVQEWIAKNAYRVTNRGLMEIMFFFDPGTVKQIAGRPLPLLNSSVELFNFLGNTVDEIRDLPFEKDYKGVLIWEEDKKDKTKPLYYTSKMVPTRFFTDFIDFFDTFNSQIR